MSSALRSASALWPGLTSADFTSCTKCGTSAVLAAVDAVKGGNKSTVLVTASDARATKAAWFYQLWYGDGAASLLMGNDNVIAEFKGSHSVSCDFITSYRGADSKFEYGWEERWIRDEGFSKILPAGFQGLLQKCGVSADDVSKVAYPCYLSPRAHQSLAKSMGISPDKVVPRREWRVRRVQQHENLVLPREHGLYREVHRRVVGIVPAVHRTVVQVEPNSARFGIGAEGSDVAVREWTWG